MPDPVPGAKDTFIESAIASTPKEVEADDNAPARHEHGGDFIVMRSRNVGQHNVRPNMTKLARECSIPQTIRVARIAINGADQHACDELSGQVALPPHQGV